MHKNNLAHRYGSLKNAFVAEQHSSKRRERDGWRGGGSGSSPAALHHALAQLDDVGAQAAKAVTEAN
jgi:hypothetical protein